MGETRACKKRTSFDRYVETTRWYGVVRMAIVMIKSGMRRLGDAGRN
jgi:hypothetical protein